ncbi:MAG: N-acetylmuramoyl-L-alanine amidase [Cycloclasticus sp. symbiont of Bathymodiolus heckerae]|nr:MAG: N-acetylmuramoyl-L-alanine amidase [Cycloclasticus sp. symbiont of Bathymodiolus heckerae]
MKLISKNIKAKQHALICAFVFLFSAVSGVAMAASSKNVDSLRFWTAPDHTRLVLGISSPVEHKVFALDNPPRLVLDLSDAKFNATVPTFSPNHKVVSLMRHAPRNKKDLRVVIDLKTVVKAKSFLLKPNANYGHRLVIDLYPQQRKSDKSPVVVKKASSVAKNNKWIVAIDAGHGGEDPGAKGYRGTREKVVVLAIAKKLAALVNKQPNMKAYLVRSGDYYIGLRKRMEKARQARADLFVSIHADAFKDQRARGSSVYVLSNRGASSEAARWLANSENAADLVGGVSLDDKDDMLASVLLDLSQNATEDASATVASEVLKNLKGVGHVHKKQVQRAGFMVLKSPDIPSILVETAFISNRQEEAKLRTSSHQTKVAKAILKGVKAYFSQQRLPSSPSTTIAKATYKIRKGDTLSAIAQKHRVSLSSLKKINAMKGSRIKVGQIIRIPS